MPKDPVCGNEIDLEDVRAQSGQTSAGASEVDPSKGTRAFHDGEWYYFDTLDCRVKFLINPDAYLKPGES